MSKVKRRRESERREIYAPAEEGEGYERVVTESGRSATSYEGSRQTALTQRRSSLTFAFAIIGAMLVIRHGWFGITLNWLKSPVGQNNATSGAGGTVNQSQSPNSQPTSQ